MSKHEEFEAAYVERYPNIKHLDPDRFSLDDQGEYRRTIVEVSWQMWQAARCTVSGQEGKPFCDHCNRTNVELLRLCHNSSCRAYAREQSFYRGWEDDAAPIPATGAEKDAALTDEWILELWHSDNGVEPFSMDREIVKFARAILAANGEKK